MLLHKLKVIKENEIGFYVITFLSGSFGALFILLITHFFQSAPIKIGTVNVTGIVDQFIKQETRKNLSQDILKNEVRKFGLSLDKEINEFSKKHKVVLFLHEAVISGGRDYTNEIKIIMQRHLENRDE